jgi:hypothetical protein
MASENRTGDPLIDEAEAAEDERGGGREERAANLFDIRRIIGGLFLLYGLVLLVLGFGASDADIRRAHGLNVNLAVGIALLVVACFFIAWALLRPLGRELQEAEAGRAGEHDSGERRFERDERSSSDRPKVPETR